MEGGNRPSGAWTGKIQPSSREQAQIQPTTMQQYSQVPSFKVSTPQQHHCFVGGVTAGQSPTAPQLPGFGRSFQQQTLTGVVAPSPPQSTRQMFISNNVAHLPGSAPMGDVMHNQQNPQSPPPPQQQSVPQMMRYPVQLSHQQKRVGRTRALVSTVDTTNPRTSNVNNSSSSQALTRTILNAFRRTSITLSSSSSSSSARSIIITNTTKLAMKVRKKPQ